MFRDQPPCLKPFTLFRYGQTQESGTTIERTPAGVVEFVVQLEVEVRDTWKPVIRYDTAHGYAHIDRYKLRRRSKKERLALSFSEALTRAERDIKQNWSVYREQFLKGEWP